VTARKATKDEPEEAPPEEAPPEEAEEKTVLIASPDEQLGEYLEEPAADSDEWVDPNTYPDPNDPPRSP
jgi:hypothetical protein